MKTPNFTGLCAIILHQEDGNTERLCRQLGLLGITARQQWSPLEANDLPDLILVDADQGWDDLLPWTAKSPSRPVVALLASEAPGRIAWALRQGACAIIAKPIAASAIYPALVMATSIHRERQDSSRRMEFLEERLRLRPLVFSAVERLKTERRLDDEQAYGLLRDCAMRRRLPIEQVAAFFLGGSETLSEAG
jgi:AmiR/NasT family two-component response regulator